MVTGETLAALKTLGAVLDDLAAGSLSIDDLAKVIQQIDRIIDATPGKPPSAYSIAKLLLILSGDVDEPDASAPARRLVYILKGANPDVADAAIDAAVDELQAIIGLAIVAVGTIVDRAFASPGGAAARSAPRGPGLTLPAINQSQQFTLAHANGRSLKLREVSAAGCNGCERRHRRGPEVLARERNPSAGLGKCERHALLDR